MPCAAGPTPTARTCKAGARVVLRATLSATRVMSGTTTPATTPGTTGPQKQVTPTHYKKVSEYVLTPIIFYRSYGPERLSGLRQGAQRPDEVPQEGKRSELISR